MVTEGWDTLLDRVRPRSWRRPGGTRVEPPARITEGWDGTGQENVQLARVAEWQTRWTQNPLSERACGFESRPGHPCDVARHRRPMCQDIVDQDIPGHGVR